jgi:hypothetical protein
MAQIFLSYRRADSRSATGRIVDRLRDKLDAKDVLQDVGETRLGENLETRVDHMLEECAVMLVVIGLTASFKTADLDGT